MKIEVKELKLNILTPVHIGDGGSVDTVFEAHLVNNETKAKLIDKEKLIECIKQKNELHNLKQLIKKMENMNQNNRNELSKEIAKKIEDICNGHNIYSKELDVYINKSEKPKALSIASLIKVRGKPYIPGSSILGILQSFLAYYYCEKNSNYNTKNLTLKGKKHFLRVIDSTPFDTYNISLIESRSKNKKEGRKTNVPSYNEVISPNQETNVKIVKKEYAKYNLLYSDYEKWLYNLNLDEMIDIWIKVSRKFLKKDKNFWESYRFDDSLKNEMDRFYKSIENKNIVYIGHFTKGHSAIKHLKETTKLVSRAIAYYNNKRYPVGLVEIMD